MDECGCADAPTYIKIGLVFAITMALNLLFIVIWYCLLKTIAYVLDEDYDDLKTYEKFVKWRDTTIFFNQRNATETPEPSAIYIIASFFAVIAWPIHLWIVGMWTTRWVIRQKKEGKLNISIGVKK